MDDLAGLLRDLRRRHARSRRDRPLTYRELAIKTGWSQAAIAEYFTARTLPPTDRLDALVEVLTATPAERHALATARDRIEENQRRIKTRHAVHPAPPTPSSGSTLVQQVAIAPRQLPAVPRLFTARARELAWLDKALDEQSQGGGMLVISAIGGMGGIGKTWLALRWAHQNLDRFPDGQLYVNLRGFDPAGQPVEPAAAVRGFLEALGVASATIPVDVEAQVGLYRSLIADKRMLIMLDNAREANQLIPLLPGGSACMVLVTSRHHLGALVAAHGARTLDLDVFTDLEARRLLIRHLGEHRVSTEPQATAELVAHCAGLPLALGIVAARAARHPDFSLATLAAELRDASTRLSALEAGDPRVTLRAVLSWSIHALSPEAISGFGLLALSPGPDIGPPAAASLLAQPVTAAQALLAELEDASLLQQSTPGRYRMHDLIRLYATDRAEHDHTPAEREAALRRVLDFYIHTAHNANRLLAPGRAPIQLDPPTPGAHAHPLTDIPAAMTWFQAEHPNLLGAQQAAIAHHWHPAVWQLAWALHTFHFRRARLQDELAVGQAALEAASHLSDLSARIRVHRFLGDAYAALDRHDEAIGHLQQALALADQYDAPTDQAQTHEMLAWAWAQQDDYRQALHHATRALDLFRTLNQPLREAGALNSVGWYAALLGHYDTARAHCQAALTLYERHHDPTGQAATLDSLGYIEHHTGHHHHAIQLYQQALTMYRSTGNTYDAAGNLDRLGHPQAALGQHEQARATWQQALELYQTQHRDADTTRVQHQLDTLT